MTPVFLLSYSEGSCHLSQLVAFFFMALFFMALFFVALFFMACNQEPRSDCRYSNRQFPVWGVHCQKTVRLKKINYSKKIKEKEFILTE